MNHVFMDTVGLVALWNRADQWHAAASAAMAQLRSTPTAFYSTTYIMLECGNAVARQPFRVDADATREQLHRAGTLIRPTDEEWDEAWAAYRRGHPGSAGIVDNISFIVMRRLAISKAFTNDHHFKAAGFETLF